MGEDRTDLLSLGPVVLQTVVGDFLRELKEPAYRADQLAKWVYGGEAQTIPQMTNLPRGLREALAEKFVLAEPEVERVSRSKDGTTKHLWRLGDGELVESVLIPTGDRLTLCISSQAGCAMGCTFCATGWSGFARQLSVGEIVAQYRASRRWASAEGHRAISNIVYMGMGEPLSKPCSGDDLAHHPKPRVRGWGATDHDLDRGGGVGDSEAGAAARAVPSGGIAPRPEFRASTDARSARETDTRCPS